MASTSERGNPILIGEEGKTLPCLVTSVGGDLSGYHPQTGGSGTLIGFFFLGHPVSEQWVPRSEEDGGQGVSLVAWTGSTSPMAKQFPFTDDLSYSEGWGGEHVTYPVTDGVFEGSLGFGSGEFSTGLSIPLSDLTAATALEKPIFLSEGFHSPPTFSPSDVLVDVEPEEAIPALVRGAELNTYGEDTIISTDFLFDKKGFPHTKNSQRGERTTNTPQNKEGRHTKSVWCARDRASTERLVFGEDVAMDRVLDFSERAVVGRVRGKNLGMAFLKGWVNKTWLPELSKMPHIRLLTRGWFAFIFSSSEEVDWVLKKVWCFADTPTLLKRWTPTFDAKREIIDEDPIWVRLPGLPMQYWNTHRFASIGDLLGSYLEADMSFEDTRIMTVAHILVKINLKKGLLQELTIESAAGTFVQMLDYEGIPFRCHRCHVYGHGVATFPLPFKGSDRKSKGTSSSSSPPRKKLETPWESERLKGKGMQRTEKLDTKDPIPGRRSSQGTRAFIPKAADLLTSPTAGNLPLRDRTFSGMSPLAVTTGTSLPFISLEYNFLEVNKGIPPPILSEKYSLHNLPSLFCSLSSSSSVFSPPLITPSTNLGRAEEPEQPMDRSLFCHPPFSVKHFLPPDPSLEPPSSLTSAASLLSTLSLAQATPSASTDSSSEDSRVHYHLRNRSVVKEDPLENGSQMSEGRGLGSLPRNVSVGKGRGQKSHLYLAQDRAKIDLASGRQSSIEWALREKPPQEEVSP
jgi:hypothetical protein